MQNSVCVCVIVYVFIFLRHMSMKMSAFRNINRLKKKSGVAPLLCEQMYWRPSLANLNYIKVQQIPHKHGVAMLQTLLLLSFHAIP